jgi:hypothetical protein
VGLLALRELHRRLVRRVLAPTWRPADLDRRIASAALQLACLAMLTRAMKS